MLASVYAGDTLAAVTMGLRAGPVFHWWFPSYEQALSRYSPGLILLLCLAEKAESLGLEVIDLGKDHALYKERWANRLVPLAEGSVTTAAPSSAVRVVRRDGGRSRYGAHLWRILRNRSAASCERATDRRGSRL